jgi:hypothetical protein
MGLRYRQDVHNQRKDIKVIVSSLLKSKAYQPIARKILNELQIDFNSKNPLKQIVQRATKKEIPILAYRELPPIEGFKSWPLGVTWQWIEETKQIQISKVVTNVLSFCSRWPHDLYDIAESRNQSHVIIQRIYESVIVDFFTHTEVTGLKQKLKSLQTAMKEKDVEKLQRRCKILSQGLDLPSAQREDTKKGQEQIAPSLY